jgi:hypothetical protein
MHNHQIYKLKTMAIFVGPRVINITNSNVVGTGTGFTVHTFSTPGASSFTPTGTGTIDVLVVGAGGGGRGPGFHGGGGGGSARYTRFIPVIGGTSYPITIGTGAIPSGTPGGPTIFSYNGGTITAPGGGGGGPGSGAGIPNPLGSGGGSSFPYPDQTGGGIGANVIGLGFNGSPWTPNSRTGGGGGAGGAAILDAGGIGLSNNITGSTVFYGAGGSGWPGGPSTPSTFGTGGTGGPGMPVGVPGCIIIRYIT